MRFHATSPMPLSSETSLDFLESIFLFLIYFAMQFKESLIFLESDGRCSKELWRETGWNLPFQHSGSVGWFLSYLIWMLIMSSEWHVLVIKIVDGGLHFLFSLLTLFYFSFLFLFFILFSIFRTTQVRGYLSHCHISHKLMA